MSESVLFREICEQPESAQRVLDNEWNTIQQFAKKVTGHFDHILIAARGSSDNAARYAQYLFGNRNRIQVSLATPSLYSLYKTPPALNKVLVIGISQSGMSPDIIEVIKNAKNQHCPTLAITNNLESPLADNSDFVISIHAGIEKSIAATKSYSSTLLVLSLISLAINQIKSFSEDISNLPKQMQLTINATLKESLGIQRYRFMDQCTVIGRGYQFGTAFEIALKIKEINRIIAESYSSADFRHGPIATIQNGFPVIILAPSGEIFPDTLDLINLLEKKKSELIVISDLQEVLKSAKLPFLIPSQIPEWLSPLVCVIPGQIFAMQLAIEKGIDPDLPIGLTKVTETF